MVINFSKSITLTNLGNLGRNFLLAKRVISRHCEDLFFYKTGEKYEFWVEKILHFVRACK